jgi:hypothetical protein
VKPQEPHLQIPEETLFSFKLAHDGHSFFDLRRRWTFE